MSTHPDARRPPLPIPERPPGGPFRREFWRSPLRGPWLASILGSALLPLIVICAVTGLLSHAAYNPDLGRNSVTGSGGGLDLYFFDWPTHPAWLYALTQGLHVTAGVAAIPILLAKLWAVIPKLFEWPPVRSLAHGLERLSLALLVGGSLFVFFTGLWNVQVFTPWHFPFVPAHYYGAFVFIAALALHVGLKLRVARRAFHELGVIAPLRANLEQTEAEALPRELSGAGVTADDDSTRPLAPARPTMSRRGLLATVGLTSLGLAVMAGVQSVGGPFRRLGLLAPHGRTTGTGPNDFQVNKTAKAVGLADAPHLTGDRWRLQISGRHELELSRAELLAMPQYTEILPIACVEGWSTTQTWTGVRLRDLAAMAGSSEAAELHVESLQKAGAFRQATLSRRQLRDSRSLLALKVNGADLALDHGFPARVIVPALPGVHNTKWVGRMTFQS